MSLQGITYVPDPHFMEVHRWTAEITRQSAVIPQLTGDDWQFWAANVMIIVGLDAPTLPDPYSYNNWQDWATEFKKVTEL